MQPETYRMLAARQAVYWWHRARRAMGEVLLRHHALAPGFRLLDLGCGPGGNFRMLDALGPALVVGVDLSPLALELARTAAPSANLIRADMNRPLPFANGSFDVAVIFNVLYHDWIMREADVLREVWRILRHGGFVLITEPAFKALAREKDIAVMGHRRYRTYEISDLCRSTGFDPLVTSYFTWFGFPILLALKWAKRIRLAGGSLAADMKPLAPAINSALYAAAVVEARAIAGGLKMPCGTTIVCLARKMA